MKHYEDDDVEDREEGVRGVQLVDDGTPTDRFGKGDWALAVGLGLGVFVLLSVWAFPGLSPDVWNPLVEAAGVRPAGDLCPGLWRGFTGFLCDTLGLARTLAWLPVLGRLSVAVTVGLVYLLFREGMALMLRMRLQRSRARTLVARLSAGLGAFLFGCSDAVWHAGQAFGPVTWLLLLAILGLYLFFTFLQRGHLFAAYGAMFVQGVLAAESPFGFVILAACWGTYFLAARRVLSLDMPLLNPFVEQITKWHMTFLFVLGFAGTVVLNCHLFVAHDGLAATGWTLGDLPQQYGLALWHAVTGAASKMDWVLTLGVVLLPTVLQTVLLPGAADEEQFLPYRIGVIFLLTGLLAFAQVSSVDALWYWTWLHKTGGSIDAFVLCLALMLNAMSITGALATLGVDAYCRDHRRLAIQRYAEMRAEIDAAELPGANRFTSFLRRAGVVIVPLVLLAGVVPGRALGKARTMLGIVRDYLEETVREAGDATALFTDGLYDGGVELESAKRGGQLKAHSMMADNSPRNVYLRTRGMKDQEDILAMTAGAAGGLRTWIRDRPDRLKTAAAQLGFELWKRDGKALPLCSGVLARSEGLTAEERTRGIEAARALARRVLDVYKAGGPASNAGSYFNELFLFCQWRLARMARLRAEHADLAGKAELALDDVKLSDELDLHNASLRRILESMERQRRQALRQMTPREGLQLALVRADYALARRYAEPILQSDPEDPDANFGMGMNYLTQDQYARAEEFLRRCLVRRPREPAVYNNLAMLQLKAGRYEAALKNAEKALALLPNSAEVRDTVEQIRKAAERAKNRSLKKAAEAK